MDDAASNDVGENEAIEEEVGRFAAVRFSDHAGEEAGFDGKTFLTREMFQESAGGIADLEAFNRLIGDAPLVEVGTGLGCEAGVVEIGGRGEDFLHVAGFLRVEKLVVAYVGKRYPGAGGEAAKRLHEGEALAKLHEFENISPDAAAETFEILALGVDVKARGLFLVEGAEGLV
jgi:hypothetical protein